MQQILIVNEEGIPVFEDKEQIGDKCEIQLTIDPKELQAVRVESKLTASAPFNTRLIIHPH